MTSPRIGALIALAAFLLGCAPGVSIQSPDVRPLTAEDRDRAARRDLENARLLRRQGRSEAAARAAARGLELEPPDPKLRGKLHRLRAELLSERGEVEAAREHAASAQALDPPPSPLPSHAMASSAHGIEIALLPPLLDATTVIARLQKRLPSASLSSIESDTHPTAQSVDTARAWMHERAPRALVTLRVDRASCGSTPRLGRFSVVWIRIAEAAANGSATPPELMRFSEDADHAPTDPAACAREALARALEAVLEGSALEAALSARSPPSASTLPSAPTEGGGDAWSSKVLRDLFPALGIRLASALDAGRKLLEAGQLEAARDQFAEALAVDPEDSNARAYYAEVEQTLALAAQLDRQKGRAVSGRLDPGLTPEQRRRIEAQIADQQRERERILAALAVVEDEPNLPASLRPDQLQLSSIEDPNATGPTLARSRAGDVVEARHLYSPDGSVLARYFLEPDAQVPILREEDTTDDGKADRWTAYRDRKRSDVWDDSSGNGRIDRHLVYDGGGEALVRVEIDGDGDERFDRLLYYQNGSVRSERRDTTGDGKLDTSDQLAEDGSLRVREEDRNGDGEVDVRSHYDGGRLQRREIIDPSLANDLRRRGDR